MRRLRFRMARAAAAAVLAAGGCVVREPLRLFWHGGLAVYRSLRCGGARCAERFSGSRDRSFINPSGVPRYALHVSIGRMARASWRAR